MNEQESALRKSNNIISKVITYYYCTVYMSVEKEKRKRLNIFHTVVYTR